MMSLSIFEEQNFYNYFSSSQSQELCYLVQSQPKGKEVYNFKRFTQDYV